ncbi:hypothetical protein [Segetibacter koreensis]|uniref:hypothetical protein n=1 Tax=Segetibacter koreensis TaxID=398037 RepID=UPI00037B0C09|nr:hypothetical protein [Segetibacter koreensis]
METIIEEKDKAKIIKEILDKIDSDYSVSVGDVLAKFRDQKQNQSPRYDLRITATLMEGICSKITSIYIDQYQYKIIPRGEITQCIITKNPNYKLKSWHEKYPVRYEWFKGVITGIITLAVAIIIWLIDKQKGDKEYKELKQRLDSVVYKMDSLSKSSLSQKAYKKQ